MAYEKIVMEANGKPFEGWEEFDYIAAVKQATCAFRIQVSEIRKAAGSDGAVAAKPDSSGDAQVSDNWHFPPFTPIKLTTNGDLLLDGYVDDYDVFVDANVHRVTIVGRGKGADFVDASVDHPTGQFINRKLEDIAKELDVSGVGIKTDVNTGAPIPVFRVRQGSTPFEEIQRLAQQRKLVMAGQPDGSILITRAGNNRHAGGLYDGVNIETARALLSGREKFSDEVVIGQSSDMFSDPQIKPEGKSSNPTVPRQRKRVTVAQAQTDPTLARQHAEYIAARTSGISAHATITTPSFRDSGGKLWTPSWSVFVKSAYLKLEQDMIIEEVSLSQSQRGTLATLKVVDPKSYGGDSEGDSSPMWRPA